MRRTAQLLNTALALALLAAPTRADVDLQIGNGDKVTGTLSPGSESETFRFVAPRGAALSVAVKGRKPKGGQAPVASFRLFAPDASEIGASSVSHAGAGAKLVNFPLTASGEHRVVVEGDGAEGDYQLLVKWRSPKKFQAPGAFSGPEALVPFAAEEGALVSFAVKAAPGSAAQPRVAEIRDGAAATVLAFTPAGAGSGSDAVKNVRLPAGGDLSLVLTNAGAAGAFGAAISVRPPAPSKRSVAITSREIGAAGIAASAVGRLVGPAGGGVDAASVPGIEGASIVIAPGALPAPTGIFLATSPAMVAPGQTGAGPTVLFGPEGLKFAQPGATITIPFNRALFGGDTSALRVFTRDAAGRVTEVPGVTIDEPAGTVSFAVSHFSSFRVFRQGKALPLRETKADLNDDGFDDLVVPAPVDANSGSGRVFVWFGSADSSQVRDTSTTADAVFTGFSNSDEFGSAVATGDLNGDGVADLVVGAARRGRGAAYVFFGGPAFAGEGVAGADVTFTALVSDTHFGGAVAVGDVNGDGTDDLAVGAYGDATRTGSVFVFPGGAGISSLTTSAAAAFTGEALGDDFGWDVAVADVSGDRVGDLVVGASQYDAASADGRAYVFLGGPSFQGGPATGAAIRLDTLDLNTGFAASVAAGDVNGDGVGDVVVGSPLGKFDGLDGSGAVHVFLGGPALSSRHASDADVFFYGEHAFDTFGEGLETGDLDGDGDAEIVTSAGGDDTIQDNAGAIYVFGGGGAIEKGVTVSRKKVSGTSYFNVMKVVLRPVDLNGDGRRECVFAGPRLDTNAANTGSVFVQFGRTPISLPGPATGADVIHTGAQQNTFLGGR